MTYHDDANEVPVGVEGDVNIQALVESFVSKPGDFIFSCGGSIPIVTEDLNDKNDVLSTEDVEKSNKSNDEGEELAGDLERVNIRERRYSDGSNASMASTAESTTSTLSMVSTTRPVTIRWDANDPSTAVSKCRLTFPGTETAENITQLMADMQPATFGRDGKDVYDETYRKASKMDIARFSSDFDPHALGIIDTIAQLLLPDFAVGKGHGAGSKRCVRAELYKLNVYSGPTGHFRAHVDTPRSASQFGSLVVCLPIKHEGGELEIRHKGQTMTFNWGVNQAKPAIQWAAFYSDCEHEVLEVKSGHRVTLTYNLYAVRGHGMLAGHSSAVLRPETMPLYDSVKSVFKKEDFMPEGGYLGIWTVHAYAHTSDNHCLPDALKGTDMVVWETLRSLGCEMHLRPVLNDPWFQEEEEWWLEQKVRTEEEIAQRVKEIPQTMIGHSGAFTHENYDGQREDYECLRWAMDCWRRPGNISAEEEEIRAEKVVWLTPRPSDKDQVQITYIAYGNEPSLGFMYSDCAILAKVPSVEARIAAPNY